MQIKKNEVRQDLLEAAAAHFVRSGFEKASVRDIVKSANTTIGNFYNYFESKEAIFSALTESMYQEFAALISLHNIEDRDSIIISHDINLWRSTAKDLMHPLLSGLDETFLLLIENENGRLGDLKKQLIDLLAGHFKSHIDEFSPEYPFPELGRIAAIGILAGICEVIRTEKRPEKRVDLIAEIIVCFSCGLLELFKE